MKNYFKYTAEEKHFNKNIPQDETYKPIVTIPCFVILFIILANVIMPILNWIATHQQ